jgi:hypothetical protein
MLLPQEHVKKTWFVRCTHWTFAFYALVGCWAWWDGFKTNTTFKNKCYFSYDMRLCGHSAEWCAAVFH